MHFLYGEWVLHVHAVFHYLLDILDQHKVTLCNHFKILFNNINRNYYKMVNFDRMIKIVVEILFLISISQFVCKLLKKQKIEPVL